MSKVFYIHRRFAKDGGIDNLGGNTIAYRVNDSGYVEFGIAFCSPHDNYNKKFGRNKAAGRLNSDKYRHVTDLNREQFLQEVL